MVLCALKNRTKSWLHAEFYRFRPTSTFYQTDGLLSNIRHRLELLNVQLAEVIRLDFEDLYDEQGQATGTEGVVRMSVVGV